MFDLSVLSFGALGYWLHVFADASQPNSRPLLVPSGFKIFHRPFGEMEEALQGEEVDGVLMDLGVSNNQAGLVPDGDVWRWTEIHPT